MNITPPPQDSDRVEKFTAIQADPEVWALVQQKYQHFEDMKRQLSEQQDKRRQLLDQLSEINDGIKRLTEELASLSGQQVEAAESQHQPKIADSEEDNDLNSHQDRETLASTDTESVPLTQPTAQPEPVSTHRVDWQLDSESHESHESGDGSEVPANPPAEASSAGDLLTAQAQDALSNLSEQVDDAKAPKTPEASISEPESKPQLESQPELQSQAPEVQAPAEEASQPVEPPTATTPTPAPTETPQPVVTSGSSVVSPVPSEVAELQKIFDGADATRRQTDSALKLVQLYDGKAEGFYQAMCRSHQQNGLSQEESQKEATKDVQTMIATAKVQEQQAIKDKNGKTNGSTNGMRRLFNH